MQAAKRALAGALMIASFALTLAPAAGALYDERFYKVLD